VPVVTVEVVFVDFWPKAPTKISVLADELSASDGSLIPVVSASSQQAVR
jgi:hypothetical protein